MTKTTEFIKICICFVFFSYILFAQAKLDIHPESKVEACLTQHFIPVGTVSSELPWAQCYEADRSLCFILYGISQRNQEGIRCLVNADFNFNVESGKYKPKDIPIMAAAFFDVELLRLILKSKTPINVDVKDKDGRTALLFVNLLDNGLLNYGRNFSWERVYQSTELLLKNGADPNAVFNERTSLMIQAAKIGGNKYVALLLQYKANPDRQSPEGETALMLADDDPEKIKLLLDADANIYLNDNQGNSAIFHAVENCQVNKIEALLKKDENILKSVNAKGITALKYLKKRSLSTKCRELKKMIPAEN